MCHGFALYLSFLRPYAAYALGVEALLTLVLGLFFLEPLFVAFFMNEIVLQADLGLLIALIAAMVCTAAAAYYAWGVAKYHGSRLGQIVLADMRRAFFQRLLRKPPCFFEKHNPSELLELSTIELDALDAVREAIFGTPATLFSLGIIFGFCWMLDPGLAPVVLVPVPFMLLLLALDGRMRRRNEAVVASQARLCGFLGHRLSNVLTVQAFLREDHEVRSLDLEGSRLVEARASTEALAQVQQRGFNFLRSLVLAAVLLIGGTRWIRGSDISLGALFGVFMLAELFLEECLELFAYIVKARLASVSLNRVLSYFDDRNQVKPSGKTSIGRAKGRVELDRVRFRYSDEMPWILDRVSFVVEPGEVVAIVGKSGSGKSTLFRLLMRFLDPSEGAIRIDGHDLRGLSTSHLRQQYGLLTQKPVIFEGSVEDNIRYGRPEATFEDVVAASEKACALPFIERLPRGFTTNLGATETELSGGEQHRLSLARVVLKDAPILLLDEVTSGLDAKTEAEVQGAVNSARQGRTTIVIAHHLSTVLDADRILVMDQGRIVETGTHEQLYEKRGQYRQLFDAQFHVAIDRISRRLPRLRPDEVRREAPAPVPADVLPLPGVDRGLRRVFAEPRHKSFRVLPRRLLRRGTSTN